MDMAFATSLGISDSGLVALMRDAGFRPADAPDEQAAPVEIAAEENTQQPVEAVTVEVQNDVDCHVREGEDEAVGTETKEPLSQAEVTQPVFLTHWRWIGLPKPRPPENRQPRSNPEGRKPEFDGKPKSQPQRIPAPPKPAAPPSALALQLAALKGLKL